MRNISKLIVPIDKENTKFMLQFIPIFMGVLCFLAACFFHLYNTAPHWAYTTIWSVMLILVIFSILLFSIVFLFSLWLKNESRPLATLDRQGIWCIWYGFIPWQYIIAVRKRDTENRPPQIDVVEIFIDRSYPLYEQISIPVRMKFEIEKLYHAHYYILLSNMTVPAKDIVIFSSSFLRTRE